MYVIKDRFGRGWWSENVQSWVGLYDASTYRDENAATDAARRCWIPSAIVELRDDALVVLRSCRRYMRG